MISENRTEGPVPGDPAPRRQRPHLARTSSAGQGTHCNTASTANTIAATRQVSRKSTAVQRQPGDRPR